jgi:hypothetical protein
MQRSSVLLPEPLAPMRHTTSESFTSRLTSCKTCKAPNRLLTALMSILLMPARLDFA